jgi:hypothetical protein
MINIFLQIIFIAVFGLISLLPNVSTTSGFGSAITTASGYISALHSFVPYTTTTMLSILAFDIVFESGYLAFKGIYWVIRRFPTQS